LITGVPGLLAVGVTEAVSLIWLPRTTGPLLASVEIPGTTGFTVKHSVEAESLAFGTPFVPEVKSARQQYLPADVTAAAAETMVAGLGLLTLFTDIGPPTAVPPDEHVPVAIGPQSENCRLPDQFVVPLMTKSAESLTDTEPAVVIGVPVAGTLVVPSASFGVVVTCVSQSPKVPRTKSFNTADVEVEDRVSEATVAKHSLAMPPGSNERLIPPS